MNKPVSQYSLPALSLCALFVLSGCQSLPSRDGESAQTEATTDTATDSQPWTGAPEPHEPPGTPAGTSLNAPGEQDLWERIRQGFVLNHPDNRRVRQHLKWYAKHPRHMERIGERARPYLHYIVEALDQRKMPLELALLPVIESGFRPSAYSSYRAAGIWQFIPSTGKMFGLKQNWWYDGRRDVVAATSAALDYLQSLAGQFDGDWELALAAYNSGAGTVRKAIRKNRERGKPTDYWSLKLPRETQSYVPRLLALAQVVSAPDHFGNRLPAIPNQTHFATVATGSQIDLAKAAQMAGVSDKEFRQLNPGFKRWASAPEGPHRLALPIGKVGRFTEKLAQLETKARLPWSRYPIRSGDTLGGIARRHGTSVTAIKKANKLSSNRIRAGRYLLIPGSIDKAPDQPKLAQSPAGGSHTVRSGESLWSIAQRYRISHKKLAAWNGIALMDPLKPGQRLVVQRRSKAASPASLSYQVRKGDSLARIARRFNVKVSDLRKWNHLPGKYLQPGQSIQLQLSLADQSI